MKTKAQRFDKDNDSIVFYPDNYINDIEGEKLEDMCNEYLKKGVKRIVIDFTNADLVNSIGISFLVGIAEKIKDYEGILFFSGLKKVHMEVFDICGLSKHVLTFKTEDEALAKIASA